MLTDADLNALAVTHGLVVTLTREVLIARDQVLTRTGELAAAEIETARLRSLLAAANERAESLAARALELEVKVSAVAAVDESEAATLRGKLRSVLRDVDTVLRRVGPEVDQASRRLMGHVMQATGRGDLEDEQGTVKP